MMNSVAQDPEKTIQETTRRLSYIMENMYDLHKDYERYKVENNYPKLEFLEYALFVYDFSGDEKFQIFTGL